MKVYLYNDNFEYIGESEVSGDALPRNSTTIAPLSPDDVVFNGIAWVTKTSHTYTAAEQAEVDARMLIESKQQKLQSLKAWHDSQVEAMTAKYSDAQVRAFPKKEAEANAWRLDNTVNTPYVSTMCNNDPVETVAELNAILAKIDAVAQLDGYIGRLQTAIKNATTQAELDAIVW